MKPAYLKLIVILVLAFCGCRKNDPVKPAPPDTKIFLDKINLSGSLRLTTSVQMHWTGYSSSGFVTGYEISFDNVNWKPTKSTDSTFLFKMGNGQDSANINFYVRAIDNYGQRDPTPARLLIPIKNSPPNVAFSTTLPDTVYTVFSLQWAVHDPDGDSTIDSVFIKFNNSGWYLVSPQVSFASFIPQNVTGNGIMNALVYKNLSPSLLNQNIGGLNLNGLNRLYIKAKDNAGAYSLIDSTGSFYIKNKTSDLLVINANNGIDPKNDPLKKIVGSVYGKFDFIDFIIGNQKYQPQFWSPTFNLELKLYDKVFIYSDGLRTNGKMVLEYAANALSDFLNNNGKLLVSSILPIDMDPASAIFNFSPADSISSSKGQARFYQDSLAVHDPTYAAILPDLKDSAFILGAEPIYLKSNAETVYRAGLARIGGWAGPNIVCAKTLNTNGKTQQVFWSVDLSLMNGDPAALTSFFNGVLLQYFNW